MINRSIIEEVMASATSANPDDPDGRGDRNLLRTQAVESFLDGNSEANIPGPQGRSARDMILDDLPSYSEWERG